MSSLRSNMRSSVLPKIAGWALAGLLLGASASPAFASDEHADEAAPEEQEHQGGHGHGGPIHLRDIVGSTEFWGAVINFTLLVWLLRRYGAKPLRQFDAAPVQRHRTASCLRVGIEQRQRADNRADGDAGLSQGGLDAVR